MQCVYLTQLSRKMESAATLGYCHSAGWGGQGEWKLKEHLLWPLCQNLVNATEHKRGNCSNKNKTPARCDRREMTIIFSSNGLLLGSFSKLL